MDRRDFLKGSMGAAILASRSADSLAQNGTPPPAQSWDAGQVRHLLPTVSDTRILIKASFASPLSGVPALRIGASSFSGKMTDTEGTFCRELGHGPLRPAGRNSPLRRPSHLYTRRP